MKHEEQAAALVELDALLEKLVTILTQEGTEGTRYAQRTLEMMRRNIALAEGQPSPELLAFLREDVASLFPPKAGLSEFYCKHEDAKEQRRRNLELEALLRDIRQLLA